MKTAREERSFFSPQDALVLIDHIIDEGVDHSRAITRLRLICLRQRAAPPCQEIGSLQDLATYLKDHADNPMDLNAPLATTGAVFVIIHPPSGIHSSNGRRPFASVCHHNFGPYSMSFTNPSYSGPQLWTPKWRGMRSPTRAAIPFALFTGFDADPNDTNPVVFRDRSGIFRIGRGCNPYGNEIVFHHKPFVTSDGWPDHHPEGVPYVFVPIKKNGRLAEGWEIFALPTHQLTPLPPNLLQNNTVDPDDSTQNNAGYVSLETGNPLIDCYFNAAWLLSASGIGGIAGLLAYKTLVDNEIKTVADACENIEIVWPHLLTICCGAPLLFPLATLIRAIIQDSKR